jgi:hypothetical protein
MKSTLTANYATPDFLGTPAVPIPPELLAQVPRRIVAKNCSAWPAKAWRVEQWAKLAVLIAATAYVLIYEYLWSTASIVSGVVQDKHVHTGERNSKRHLIYYSFPSNQTILHDTGEVDSMFYDSVAIGDSVRVRTMEFQSARISQLLDSSWKDGDYTGFAWTLIFGVVIALPVSVLRSRWVAMNQRHLITTGVPAVARVTRVTSRSLRPEWPVAFEFVTADGCTRVGASKRVVIDPKSPAMKIGDSIVILYDSIRPSRVEVYSAMAYTAAQVSSPTPV